MINVPSQGFGEPFNTMWAFAFGLCWIFFSTRCCQCYMNDWTHPPFNCSQNRPDK